MKKIIFILFALILTACQPAVKNPPSPEFDTSKLQSVERDVTYCVMDGVELKMDVYYPACADERWRALVYIHGGSWTGGDKRSAPTHQDRAALVSAGFLVVSVNYRLAPEYKFPAMIQDVKCAVRYLRAHADDYNLDANRIGAWGNSAGGHLATLLGLADSSAGWDVGAHAEYSSAVQAVADMFGPADMEMFLPANDEEVFLNADLKNASPIEYINKNAPPFLILHGDADTTVSLAQSELLAEKLKANNASVKLVIVRDGGHGFTPEDSPNMQPTRAEVTQMLVEFFTNALH
jgi:acetyl esterase/lipase